MGDATTSESALGLTGSTARERTTARWGRTVVLLPLFVVVVLLPAAWFRYGALAIFAIDGPSMEPNLTAGDRVFLDKTSAYVGPTLGSIVIAQSPIDGVDVVKRVVGVGGDVIEVRGGLVYRNGEAITGPGSIECPPPMQSRVPQCQMREESVGGVEYNIAATPDSDGIHGAPPTEIPADHYYLLGDWRERSNDSRNALIGPVPQHLIRGTVRFVFP